MAAFPHLRKICQSGFIVDSKGNNSYLIHPERMAVSTLYISGGRSLLVTPETTFLANKYVKLHQPGFRHERVVVDGFGHSDLLIGEESCKEVFPYIVSHIRLCEEGKDIVMINKEKKDGKEALDWAADPYRGYGGSESCLFSPLLVLFLFHGKSAPQLLYQELKHPLQHWCYHIFKLSFLEVLEQFLMAAWCRISPPVLASDALSCVAHDPKRVLLPIVIRITWKNPPANWYKLNSEGSSIENPKCRWSWVLIREDEGTGLLVASGTSHTSLASKQLWGA
ncbi:hypothetical protein Goshw_016020 [Gossypium schwendimanii]|uniref:Uncharacterized protein n=1 Tax=Gossypium schwendimanii TaxID=34291 RepID=A0A7J9KSE6_GOSSC|nr:hypothetical protein [Gossypium schwendimanii]